jgi:hypothetical protein
MPRNYNQSQIFPDKLPDTCYAVVPSGAPATRLLFLPTVGRLLNPSWSHPLTFPSCTDLPVPRFSFSAFNASKLYSVFSSLVLFLLPWRWRRHVPPKRQFIIKTHGATSQKMAFFILLMISLRIINFINYTLPIIPQSKILLHYNENLGLTPLLSHKLRVHHVHPFPPDPPIATAPTA